MVRPHAITLLGLAVLLADQLSDFSVFAPANAPIIVDVVVVVALVGRLFDRLAELVGGVQRGDILDPGSPFHLFV